MMPCVSVPSLVFLAKAPEHSHPTWADFTATTWIAVVLIALAAMWSIWKAVMYTIHPGEEEPDHIKRLILGDPEPLQVELSSANGAPAAYDSEAQDSGAHTSDVHTSTSGSGGGASDERPAADETAEPRHD